MKQAITQFDLVAARPLEYLNWRYCDRRGGPFTVRVAEQDGAVLAFAVTRVLDGRAYLADILALPGRGDVAEALVRDSLRLANEGGAEFLRTRLPRRHPYRDALRRCGFMDLGHHAGELFGPRHMDALALTFLDREETRIHHVLADSDYL